VCVNLIGNAIKFTHTGSVVIEVAMEPARAKPGTDLEPPAKITDNEVVLQFCVMDTGIGIEREKLERIFDIFTQGDSSVTRRYGGTGLGLAISKRLAELMGGSIRLESTAGRGSTFIVTLPFKVCTSRKDTAPPSRDRAGLPGLPEESKLPKPSDIPLGPRDIHEAASSPLHKSEKVFCESTEGAAPVVSEPHRPQRILLVEDTAHNRILVLAFLKQTNFQVDTAENGLIGFEKYKTMHYDLVLMDIEMPVMDGYTATQEIRKWEAEQGREPTPIIAVTAHALKEDQSKSRDAGCTAHLTKPIDKTRLLTAIHKAINTAGVS